MAPVEYHSSQHKSLSYHEAPKLAPDFYSKNLQEGENAIQTSVRVIFCRPAQLDHVCPPMEGFKVMVHTHRKELVVGYEWYNSCGERVTSWHDEVHISKLPGAKPIRDWRRHSKCLSCFFPAVERMPDDPDITCNLFPAEKSLPTIFDEGFTHLAVLESPSGSDAMEGIETTSGKEGDGIILPVQAATLPASFSDVRRDSPFQSLSPQNKTEMTAGTHYHHGTNTAVLMTPSNSQQSHVSTISSGNLITSNAESVPVLTSGQDHSQIPFFHDSGTESRYTKASVFPNAGNEVSQVFSDTGAAEPPNYGQVPPFYFQNVQAYVQDAQPSVPHLNVSMPREYNFAAAPNANELRKKSFPPDRNWMNQWHKQDHIPLEPNRPNPLNIVPLPIRYLLGNIYQARRRPPKFRLRGAFPLVHTPWTEKDKERSIFQGPGYTDCLAVGSSAVISQDVNNSSLYSISPNLGEVPDLLLAEGVGPVEPPIDELGILLRPMILALRNSRTVAPPAPEERDVVAQEPRDIELSDESSVFCS